MPTPSVCSRCQSLLPALPAGRVCPACGSQVPAATPPGEDTRLSDFPIFDPQHAPTASIFDPAQLPTRSADEAAPPPPKPDTPPPVLANYVQLIPLGYGGMGVVYQAIHRRTGRPAAVKFLYPGGAMDPALRTRFSTEALALARVRHPHIVEVFEVGEADGRPYLAMEFVPGEPLAQRLKAGLPDPRQSAEIVAKVSAAVAAAHRARVLHRDLKPGNVLLTPDGAVKVTDFGLAKLVDRDDRMTITGHVLGTPSYMSPEQAGGRTHAIDERTDVYGLGAILYELLCGKPPFKAESQAVSIQRALAGDVTPPGKVRPDVPAELEAVCLKCLEKDPAKRYQSAQEVADELTRWLSGEPTLQQPPTRLRRAGRWLRRHRVKAAAVGVVLLAVAGGLLGAREMDPKRQIERARARGEDVVLVPEQGPPRWFEWVHGAVLLAGSTEDDGTCGFQTAGTSILSLLPDPMTDSYRFSAMLRHEKTYADDAVVGVFVGLRDVPARADLRATRFLGFEYTDFWRLAELKMPNLKATHGLVGQDYLLVRDGNVTRPSWLSERSVPFTPTNLPLNGWRNLVVDVTPLGLSIYWDPVGDDAPPVLHIPAGRIVMRTIEHNENLAKHYPGFAMHAAAWNPRGALGVYARASAVAIKNVTVRSLPEPTSGDFR
jgi:hypothetical protein